MASEEINHSGYRGWAKNIPKTNADFSPAKIDQSLHVPSSDTGHSAWNSGGTWEERDKSAWAKESLANAILESFCFLDEASGIKIFASSIKECEGTAKLVFSRGKKRCGFDMNVKVEWKAEKQRAGDEQVVIVGDLELHDFEDMCEEDYEVHVKCSGKSPEHVQAIELVKSWETNFRAILFKWKQNLLSQ